MLNKLKNNKGFTIIEVMIVLAIAGLILLIVLLAVPALQRNSRNTAMKNDASAVVSAVTEYLSNNNGILPLVTNNTAGNNWNVCDAAACTTTPAEFKVQGNTAIHLEVAAGTPTVANYAVGNIDIDTKMKCTGTGAAVVASIRSVAVIYSVETSSSSSPQCVGS